MSVDNGYNLEALTDNRVAKALIELSSTDEAHAALAGEVKYRDAKLKQAEAHAYLKADGTIAERQAKAIISQEYDDALNEQLKAFVEFKTLDNQRNHEIRITEIWQTLSANRRKGNL